MKPKQVIKNLIRTVEYEVGIIKEPCFYWDSDNQHCRLGLDCSKNCDCDFYSEHNPNHQKGICSRCIYRDDCSNTIDDDNRCCVYFQRMKER